MIKRAAIFIISCGALLGLIISCSVDSPESPTQIIPPNVSGDGVKTVEIRLSGDSVPADGISAIQIQAVCEIDGEEATNGLPVTFTADNGDFSTNGVNPINPDQVTRSVSTTTSSGLATVYLISPTTTGNATITVTFANEAQDSDFVSFTTPNNRVSAVELTVTPDSGESPLTVEASAVVQDEDGNALPGITVQFSTDDPGNAVSPSRVESDNSGTAVSLISNIVKDTRITANAVGRIANKFVSVTNDVATGISLEVVGQSTEPILVNERGSLLLRATVSGESGNVSGKVVQFSSNDPSTTFAPPQKKTESDGSVEVYANEIRANSRITATADDLTDSITIRINNEPVAVLELINGSADAGEVVQLTFSAENSYDPEEPFGDSITNFTWSFSFNGTDDMPITVSNTSNDQLRTYTIGESAGVLPAVDDEFTVYLTVEDENGLQSTAQVTLTFS